MGSVQCEAAAPAREEHQTRGQHDCPPLRYQQTTYKAATGRPLPCLRQVQGTCEGVSAADRAQALCAGCPAALPTTDPVPRRHSFSRVTRSSGFANSAPASGGLDLRGIEALYQRYKGWAGGAVYTGTV